jgi:amino acid transporter
MPEYGLPPRSSRSAGRLYGQPAGGHRHSFHPHTYGAKHPKELADGTVITTLFNLPAFLVCIALSMLLVVGVSESAKFNNVIVAIKVTPGCLHHRRRHHHAGYGL